jgi:hypothetical protein
MLRLLSSRDMNMRWRLREEKLKLADWYATIDIKFACLVNFKPAIQLGAVQSYFSAEEQNATYKCVVGFPVPQSCLSLIDYLGAVVLFVSFIISEIAAKYLPQLTSFWKSNEKAYTGAMTVINTVTHTYVS